MIGSDGRMKLVMSNGGWESLRSEQREALNMVQMIFISQHGPDILFLNMNIVEWIFFFFS